MKRYELAIVLHPDLEMDLPASLSKMEGLISAIGGKIVERDQWSKQKLAYDIADQQYGIYVFYQFEAEPSKINELEAALRLADEVLRHLVIAEPPLPLVAAKPTSADNGAKDQKPTKAAPKSKANKEE